VFFLTASHGNIIPGTPSGSGANQKIKVKIQVEGKDDQDVNLDLKFQEKSRHANQVPIVYSLLVYCRKTFIQLVLYVALFLVQLYLFYNYYFALKN